MKENNVEDARGVILSKEEQEQEQEYKEEEAYLLHHRPGHLQQMLVDNPHARAGYYYGEHKITFS